MPAEERKPELLDCDVEQFRQLYRQSLYNGDTEASSQVRTLLDNLSPTTKAEYMREMSVMRTQFHRDNEKKRHDRARATLLNSIPNSDVLITAEPPLLAESSSTAETRALRSRFARQRRSHALAQLIRRYCTPSSPGVHPFFRGLCAIIWIQCLDPFADGVGAGRCRAEWAVDVAVFTDAGSGEWLQDAITTLIETLGFEARAGASSMSLSESPTTTQYDSETFVLTMPDWMTNVECRSLVQLFPSFISEPVSRALLAGHRRPWPIGPLLSLLLLRSSSPCLDGVKRVGHGEITVATASGRMPGYRGSLLERTWTWLLVLLRLYR